MKEKRAEEEESERLLQEMERLREKSAMKTQEALKQRRRAGSSIQSASVETEEQASPTVLYRRSLGRRVAKSLSQVAGVPSPPPPPEVTQLVPVEFDDSEGYEFESIVLDTGMATVKVRRALGHPALAIVGCGVLVCYLYDLPCTVCMAGFCGRIYTSCEQLCIYM